MLMTVSERARPHAGFFLATGSATNAAFSRSSETSQTLMPTLTHCASDTLEGCLGVELVRVLLCRLLASRPTPIRWPAWSFEAGYNPRAWLVLRSLNPSLSHAEKPGSASSRHPLFDWPS